MCLLPVLLTGFSRNPVSYNQVLLLQANNVISNKTEDCAYLFSAVQSWLRSATVAHNDFRVIDDPNRMIYLAWAQLLPVRCDWQRSDGVITYCPLGYSVTESPLCIYWSVTAVDSIVDATPEYFADNLGVRAGAMVEIVSQEIALAGFEDGANTADFYVRAIFNESETIALTHVPV
jgi:hypothetical protein